jgi:hypothetical protein
LRKYRSVDPPDQTSSPQEQMDQRLNTIQRLKTRLTSVTDNALTEFVNTNLLTLGDFKVLITIRVQCTDCNTRLAISDLFANGGCECPRVDHG